jgi:hypothetical protein
LILEGKGNKMNFSWLKKLRHPKILVVFQRVLIVIILGAVFVPDLSTSEWVFESYGVIRWDQILLWAFLFLFIAGIQLDLKDVNNTLVRIEEKITVEKKRKEKGEADPL